MLTLTFVAFTLLQASEPKAPDYAALIKASKFTLVEAVGLALKADKSERKPVRVRFGRTKLRGVEHTTLDVTLVEALSARTNSYDIVTGKDLMGFQANTNNYKLVTAIKISLVDAIAAAEKEKDVGVAVEATLELDKDDKPRCTVLLFKEGKLSTVIVDGVTGKVMPARDVPEKK